MRCELGRCALPPRGAAHLLLATWQHTPNGGTHVDGLKTAVTRVINTIARASGKLREKEPNLPGEFLREGLTAVVSVRVPEAEFEGQTKNRLGNPEVRRAMRVTGAFISRG